MSNQTIGNKALYEYLENQGINTRKPFRCLNPAHTDNNPSMSYDPRRDKVHCFACGVTYDLVDAMKLSGMDEPSAIRTKNSFYRAKNLITIDDAIDGQSRGAKTESVLEVESYWLSRGFTPATIRRFKLAVNDSMAVIPLDESYCILRSITKKNYYNPKGQPLRLYDPEIASGFVFVVEGAIDAISVYQAAYKLPGVGAVALNGVTNIAKMAMYARHDSLYCLAFDNDAPGREAQAKLAAMFDKRGMSYVELNVCGAYKDANERLIADPAGLARAVRDALESCAFGNRTVSAASKPNAQDVQQSQHVQNVQHTHQDDYSSLCSNLSVLGDVLIKPSRRFLSTGFKALDEAFGGGLPYGGLTVLGAPSGAGKTTLCLNIADNAAAAGSDVLFFSLEMPRNELILKSLSRETLRISPRDAVPCGELAARSGEPIVKAAIEAYSQYAGRIFMLEPEFPSPEFICETVERHIAARGVKPFVIVDYLQLLSPSDPHERARLSEKQVLDRAVAALRRVCRSGAPVLAISSLNRAGYAKVSMEAFKESGSIEYSSDLLLALSVSDTRAEVTVLKNRYGVAGGKGGMRFYAEFRAFR